MSLLGRLYEECYVALSGRHPNQRPWHFQWLAVKDLRKDLKRILRDVAGNVLDVGCGDAPYRALLSQAVSYRGLDVADGAADIVVKEDQVWPIESGSIDSVLCTQVLEHVRDPRHFLNEIARVLKPSGTFVVTVPFLYNEHGNPHDYWRFTANGLSTFIGEDWEIVEAIKQGGIGSTCGVLFLNWLDTAMNSVQTTRVLKGLLLPVWLIIALIVNAAGYIMDRFDKTASAYGNVLLVARRRT